MLTATLIDLMSLINQHLNIAVVTRFHAAINRIMRNDVPSTASIRVKTSSFFVVCCSAVQRSDAACYLMHEGNDCSRLQPDLLPFQLRSLSAANEQETDQQQEKIDSDGKNSSDQAIRFLEFDQTGSWSLHPCIQGTCLPRCLFSDLLLSLL